ncbi:MAG: hypothetical protein ACI311_04790 [Bacilli bacterium]
MVRFDGLPIIKSTFPNNEKQYDDFFDICRNRKNHKLDLIYESNEDLFDIALIKKWFDDNTINGANLDLVMPFCPYGQMDRKIDGSMFSFKYFAQFINSLNFTTVTIYDPHSSVMPALLNHCLVKYPMDGVYPEEYDLLFYPDNGAAKKYSEIYNYAYRFGNKRRNLDTGEIIKYEIIADKEDIEDKYILMRDDLIMGGRTFIESAKALKEIGAKHIDLYVTHLMPQAEDFCKRHKEYGIDNIFSANTLNMPWYKR